MEKLYYISEIFEIPNDLFTISTNEASNKDGLAGHHPLHRRLESNWTDLGLTQFFNNLLNFIKPFINILLQVKPKTGISSVIFIFNWIVYFKSFCINLFWAPYPRPSINNSRSLSYHSSLHDLLKTVLQINNKNPTFVRVSVNDAHMSTGMISLFKVACLYCRCSFCAGTVGLLSLQSVDVTKR